MAKGKNTLGLFKVDIYAGSPLSLINLDCLELDGYLAISVMDTLDVNNTVGVSGSVAHIGVGEGQLAWFVVVEDGDAYFCVTSVELFFSVRVVQLNVEIFIRFPTMVVDNLDLNFFGKLTNREGDDLVDSDIVLIFDSGVITSAHSNGPSSLVLVGNNNAAFVNGFAHRHVKATESVTVMLHTFVEVGGQNMLLAILLALLDNRAGGSNGDLLSVHCAFHEGFAFED